MDFKEAYISCWKKFADFSGRSRRLEYWTFFLANFVAAIVLGIIDGMVLGYPVLGGIYALAAIIPGIAVSIRRLHDTGRSGWWFLIILVPFIGGLVLLVFMFLDSQPGTNQYGPNPKGM